MKIKWDIKMRETQIMPNMDEIKILFILSSIWKLT